MSGLRFLAAPLMALGLCVAGNAHALDPVAYASGTLPAPDTVEESEVCAVNLTILVIVIGEELKKRTPTEQDQRFFAALVNVSKYWIDRAAYSKGVSRMVYIDKYLFTEAAKLGEVTGEAHMKQTENCIKRSPEYLFQ